MGFKLGQNARNRGVMALLLIEDTKTSQTFRPVSQNFSILESQTDPPHPISIVSQALSRSRTPCMVSGCPTNGIKESLRSNTALRSLST